jgi:hypothetical protein
VGPPCYLDPLAASRREAAGPIFSLRSGRRVLGRVDIHAAKQFGAASAISTGGHHGESDAVPSNGRWRASGAASRATMFGYEPSRSWLYFSTLLQNYRDISVAHPYIIKAVAPTKQRCTVANPHAIIHRDAQLAHGAAWPTETESDRHFSLNAT